MTTRMPDSDLLRRCTTGADPAALETLLQHHAAWLYAAARRQLPDRHMAEDVTQAVLLLFVRKLPTLKDHPNLGGWLFTTLRYCIAAARRQSANQRHHEQEAARMRSESHTPADQADWDHLRPHLDAAVASLNASDRHAILLRYYELRPVIDVARLLGISEEAAKKRLQRAVERLRDKLASRGVTTTAAALSATLAAQTLDAAPAAIVQTALHAATATVPAAIASNAASMMFWAPIKIAAVIILAAGLTTVSALVITAHASADRSTTALATPAPTPQIAAQTPQIIRQKTAAALRSKPLANLRSSAEADRLAGVVGQIVAAYTTGTRDDYVNLLRAQGLTTDRPAIPTSQSGWEAATLLVRNQPLDLDRISVYPRVTAGRDNPPLTSRVGFQTVTAAPSQPRGNGDVLDPVRLGTDVVEVTIPGRLRTLDGECDGALLLTLARRPRDGEWILIRIGATDIPGGLRVPGLPL